MGKKLGQMQRRVLDALVERHPREVMVGEIAGEIGGRLNEIENVLVRLWALGLVDRGVGPGTWRSALRPDSPAG